MYVPKGCDKITNSVRDSYRDRIDISRVDGAAQTGFTRGLISGDLHGGNTRCIGMYDRFKHSRPGSRRGIHRAWPPRDAVIQP